MAHSSDWARRPGIQWLRSFWNNVQGRLERALRLVPSIRHGCRGWGEVAHRLGICHSRQKLTDGRERTRVLQEVRRKLGQLSGQHRRGLAMRKVSAPGARLQKNRILGKIRQWLSDLWSQRKKQESEAWSLEDKLGCGQKHGWAMLLYSVTDLRTIDVSPSRVWNCSRVREKDRASSQELGCLWSLTEDRASKQYVLTPLRERMGENWFGNQPREKGLEAFS